MRYINKILFYFLLLLSFQSCSQNSGNKETAKEREQRLIDEYHKQVVLSKGKEALFIPKEEIEWYFEKNNFTTLDNAAINDNVCFFDTLGNIQYQALVVGIEKDIITVQCQNLKTTEYYKAPLNVNEIIDLEKNYPYEIKIYKRK